MLILLTNDDGIYAPGLAALERELCRLGEVRVVAPAKGGIKGEIYATELIGDHTLVTLKAGSDLLTVKAAKDFTARLGEKAGVAFSSDRLLCSTKAMACGSAEPSPQPE